LSIEKPYRSHWNKITQRRHLTRICSVYCTQHSNLLYFTIITGLEGSGLCHAAGVLPEGTGLKDVVEVEGVLAGEQGRPAGPAGDVISALAGHGVEALLPLAAVGAADAVPVDEAGGAIAPAPVLRPVAPEVILPPLLTTGLQHS